MRHWPTAGCVLACVLAPLPLQAGVDDILEAIKQSEFSFARSVSDVPFFPVGWLQDSYYPAAEFESQADGRMPAEVIEHSFSVGAIVPVSVAKRDMWILGGDINWDLIDVRKGPYQDQSVLQVTPVGAWLHQYGEKDMLGVFIAPVFSKEQRADRAWATSGYGGVVALHWYSDQFQLLYGGVYEYSFGQHALYPYVGVQWLPKRNLAVSLVLPWPTITYVPSPRWLLQVGITPGGSSWVQRGDDFESVQDFGSWNLSGNVVYRLRGALWLSAGVGAAGFRGLSVTSSTNDIRFEAQRSPVFTLALQVRP